MMNIPINNFNKCGLTNVRQSLITFNKAPKINVGPKVLHMTGSMEAVGFCVCSRTPMNSTLLAVFEYDAFLANVLKT